MKHLFLAAALLLALPTLAQTVRYVNQKQAELMVMPSAQAHLVGTVEGGSKATVLNVQPSGWAYVQILEAKGWLPASYLVPSIDSVTAEDANLPMMRKHSNWAIVALPPGSSTAPVALTPAALNAIKRRGAATPPRTKRK